MLHPLTDPQTSDWYIIFSPGQTHCGSFPPSTNAWACLALWKITRKTYWVLFIYLFLCFKNFSSQKESTDISFSYPLLFSPLFIFKNIEMSCFFTTQASENKNKLWQMLFRLQFQFFPIFLFYNLQSGVSESQNRREIECKIKKSDASYGLVKLS